jgi:two-component system sensor histidine kinase/response regulator
MDAGKMELELIDFEPRKVLGELVEMMALQAIDKDLELILDVVGIEHQWVKGDPGRIRQVLINLLGNAIKFTRDGEIVIRAKIDVLDNQQLRLTCDIIDTGIGIADKKLSHVFESFTQEDASSTRKYGGTGLGLAIVKQLCKLMCGDFRASSEVGKGSCFDVEILLQQSSHGLQTRLPVDIRSCEILVVNDNDSNRDMLTRQLTSWGAYVVAVKNAQSALDICQTRSLATDLAFFELAFIDMQMAKMNGCELSRRLKADERFAAINLIVMTPMNYRGGVKRFISEGFLAYLSKPIIPDILSDAIITATAMPLLNHSSSDEQPMLQMVEQYQWPSSTRILLVEDSMINQLVVQGILNEFGLEADVASNGIEAIEALQKAQEQKNYSLILMDCQMPKMDGYEATHCIRAGDAGQHHKKIPIIALTANAMVGSKAECLAAGMDDYLSKPIKPEVLMNALIHWSSSLS